MYHTGSEATSQELDQKPDEEGKLRMQFDAPTTYLIRFIARRVMTTATWLRLAAVGTVGVGVGRAATVAGGDGSGPGGFARKRASSSVSRVVNIK
jgi:hypothetical protein